MGYCFMGVPFRHPLNPPLPDSHRGTLACLSLLISSLYVWTVSLTDADRATHSPMGSLCPVLTLSPKPAAVAKEKGAVGVF